MAAARLADRRRLRAAFWARLWRLARFPDVRLRLQQFEPLAFEHVAEASVDCAGLWWRYEDG